jgi:hypothetical protein
MSCNCMINMILFEKIKSTNYLLERRKKCQKKCKIFLLLAWNLPSNICAKLIDFLKNILTSDDFIDRNRFSPKFFTRQRKLPFHILIVFLMNLIKGSYQDELDKFFKVLNGLEVPKRFVSKAALVKARMKVKYEAFIELNQQLVAFFYKSFNPITWHGFNLLAIDGSTIRLPHLKEIIDHFGVWNSTKGAPCPIARVSQMFNVLNKITIDALIVPKKIGERELAARHFSYLQSNDLLLLDRGYPAFWLFLLILSLKGNFCARVSTTKWKIVRKFYQSGKKEKIITLTAPPTSRAQCKKLGLEPIPLQLRLIRIELHTGETEILITSLLDEKFYQYEIFSELYHDRWPIEEDYKSIKCRIEIENFSGKSVLSIYQDFYAKVFSKNLVAALAFPTHQIIAQTNKNKKYEYQINFTQALSKSKGTLALLFDSSIKKMVCLISDLHDIFVKTIEPIRPGRKYPRNHKSYKKCFYLNYKPIS